MINFHQKNNRRGLILFVHGFMGGSDTWRRPKCDSFPEILLHDPIISQKFDVASFEYHTKLSVLFNTGSNVLKKLMSAVLKWPSVTTKEIIGVDEIASLLKTEMRIKLDKYDYIVAVAHSMGGLVVKSCIVKDYDAGLVSKIQLFISLAVPHTGAPLAVFGGLVTESKQVASLHPFNAFNAKLNDSWLKLKKRPTIKYFFGAHDAVVPKTSSVPADHEKLDSVSLDENHISICKPESADTTVVLAVKKFILEHEFNSAGDEIPHLKLEDISQYDKELFVLKLIMEDIQSISINNAKEVFMNAEFIRKRFSSEVDKKKISHLYDKVRQIYKDTYTNFLHGGISNPGQLLAAVHEKIRAEDSGVLECVAAGVNFIHKQGMIHQLANNADSDIWWGRKTSISYLEQIFEEKQ